MVTIRAARISSTNFSGSFDEVSPVTVQIELLQVAMKFPSKSDSRASGEGCNVLN